MLTIFSYDETTGDLTWLCGVRKGRVAGCRRKDGYILVGVDSKLKYAHHIIWAIKYPDDPIMVGEEIDHINHDPSDNRLINLRKVTRLGNMRNQSLRKNNPSGVTGVRFNNQCHKWQATIMVLGREMHLGLFDSFNQACHARKDAEVLYKFHKNHGTKR